MDIIVSARHTSLTDAMREAMTSRLEGLEKYSQLNLTKAEAVLNVERRICSVNVVLYGNHIDLDAKADDDNMYIAIHETVDKLERQLEKRIATMVDKR